MLIAKKNYGTYVHTVSKDEVSLEEQRTEEEREKKEEKKMWDRRFMHEHGWDRIERKKTGSPKLHGNIGVNDL